MSDTQQRWHADKRVPLATIAALLIQTAGVVWWAATINANVASLTADQQEDRLRIAANSNAVATLTRSEAATEQRLISIEASQRRVETSVSEILRYLRDDRRQ